MMNQKAKELGLENTNFCTPHGLDSQEHYTSCYELALITDYALKNKKFAQIVNTKTTNITINGQSRTIGNTNELLGNLNGVDGVKTGFTNNAGRCLVTSTTRNGRQIICVVLGADTKKIRTQDSVKLIEYAFSNYEYANIYQIAQQEYENWLTKQANQIELKKATKEKTSYQLEEMKMKEYPILKSEIKDISCQIEYEKILEAPIRKDQIIGKLHIMLKKETIMSLNIQVKEEIEKKNVLDYLKLFSSQYGKYLSDAIQKAM